MHWRCSKIGGREFSKRLPLGSGRAVHRLLVMKPVMLYI
jgi:hypothetical protein